MLIYQQKKRLNENEKVGYALVEILENWYFQRGRWSLNIIKIWF
jgi:hypothetical protein